MNPVLRATLSICVSTTLLGTSIQPAGADGSLWSERRNNFQKSTYPLALLPNTGAPELNEAIQPVRPLLGNWHKSDTEIPSSLNSLITAVAPGDGTIDSMFVGQAGPPIILLQDIHLNVSAQRHISSILQALITEKQIGFIGVEGAFETFPLSPFQHFSDQPSLHRVAESFFSAGKLAAPSFVAITSPVEPPLIAGVDDRIHYQANVDAYLRSRSALPLSTKLVQSQLATIEKEKAVTFSADLLSFEKERTAYHQNKSSLTTYVHVLAALEPHLPEALKDFWDASTLERQLNFSQIDNERRALLETLSRRLTTHERSTLIAQALAYRMGHISLTVFYGQLQDLLHQKNISPSPMFRNFIRYALAADRISGSALFKAIHDTELNISHHLAKSENEQRLLDRSHRWTLAEKLITFSLTPDEWHDYIKLAMKNPETALVPFENFYREADIRSGRIVERILAAPDNRAKVLVIGGFHSNDIARLLRNAGHSYVVVSPKVEQVDSEGASAYLSIFAREKTPIEKLFSGQQLTLSPVEVQLEHTGPELLADGTALPEVLNKGKGTVNVSWKGRNETVDVIDRDGRKDPAQFTVIPHPKSLVLRLATISKILKRAWEKVTSSFRNPRSSRIDEFPMQHAAYESQITAFILGQRSDSDIQRMSREMMSYSSEYRRLAIHIADNLQKPVDSPITARIALRDAVAQDVSFLDEENLAFQPGDRIGRYRVIGFLGRGTSGAVYRVVDDSAKDPREEFALKVAIASEYVGGKSKTWGYAHSVFRFILSADALNEEARQLTVAKSAFPLVSTLIEQGFDETRQRSFIVTSLLAGATIDQPDTPLSVSDAAFVAEELARFHRTTGLVHNDLNPKNILIERVAGHVSATHFLDLSAATPSAVAGAVGNPLASLVGPAKMIPTERTGGGAQFKSDVFTLAMVFAQALAPAERFRPDVVNVLQAALDENPDDRLTSDEFAKQLRALPVHYDGPLLPIEFGFLANKIEHLQSKMPENLSPTSLTTNANEEMSGNSVSINDALKRAKTLADQNDWKNPEAQGVLVRLQRSVGGQGLDQLINTIQTMIQEHQLDLSRDDHRQLIRGISQSVDNALEVIDTLHHQIKIGHLDLRRNSHVALLRAILANDSDNNYYVAELGDLMSAMTLAGLDNDSMVQSILAGSLVGPRGPLFIIQSLRNTNRLDLTDPERVRQLNQLIKITGPGLYAALLVFHKMSNEPLNQRYIDWVHRIRTLAGNDTPSVFATFSEFPHLFNIDSSFIERLLTKSGTAGHAALALFGALTVAPQSHDFDNDQLASYLIRWAQEAGTDSSAELKRQLQWARMQNSAADFDFSMHVAEWLKPSDKADAIIDKLIYLGHAPAIPVIRRLFELLPPVEDANANTTQIAAEAMTYCLMRSEYRYAAKFQAYLEATWRQHKSHQPLAAFFSSIAFIMHSRFEDEGIDFGVDAIDGIPVDQQERAQERERLTLGRQLVLESDRVDSWMSATTIDEALAIFGDKELSREESLALIAVFLRDHFSINLEIAFENTYKDGLPTYNSTELTAIKPNDMTVLARRLYIYARILETVPFELTTLNPTFSRLVITKEGRDFIDYGQGYMLLTLADSALEVFLHELGHALDPKLILRSPIETGNPFDKENYRSFTEQINAFSEKYGYNVERLSGETRHDLQVLDTLITAQYEKQRDEWVHTWYSSHYYDRHPAIDGSQFWNNYLRDLVYERDNLPSHIAAIDVSVTQQVEKALKDDFNQSIEEAEAWLAYTKKSGQLRSSLSEGEQRRNRERRSFLNWRSRISLLSLRNKTTSMGTAIEHEYVFEVPTEDPHAVIAYPNFGGRARLDSTEYTAESIRCILKGEEGRTYLNNTNVERAELFGTIYKGMGLHDAKDLSSDAERRFPRVLNRASKSSVAGGRIMWLRSMLLAADESPYLRWFSLPLAGERVNAVNYESRLVQIENRFSLGVGLLAATVTLFWFGCSINDPHTVWVFVSLTLEYTALTFFSLHIPDHGSRRSPQQNLLRHARNIALTLSAVGVLPMFVHALGLLPLSPILGVIFFFAGTRLLRFVHERENRIAAHASSFDLDTIGDRARAIALALRASTTGNISVLLTDDIPRLNDLAKPHFLMRNPLSTFEQDWHDPAFRSEVMNSIANLPMTDTNRTVIEDALTLLNISSVAETPTAAALRIDQTADFRKPVAFIFSEGEQLASNGPDPLTILLTALRATCQQTALLRVSVHDQQFFEALALRLKRLGYKIKVEPYKNRLPANTEIADPITLAGTERALKKYRFILGPTLRLAPSPTSAIQLDWDRIRSSIVQLLDLLPPIISLSVARTEALQAAALIAVNA